MKPAPFQYYAPDSLEAAAVTMNRFGKDARLLAGGQSLVASMNFRCLVPQVLVDLNVLPGLDYIRRTPEGNLHIGAMTRYRTLERDATIQQFAPLVHAAIPFIAHTAIRTRGTIGGNLAYADPASELPAVTLALGARYRAISTDGERWIAADDFFLNSFETDLQPDEILVEVVLPTIGPRKGWAFYESARRQGDRALMGTAAVVQLDPSGRCSSARLAYMNAARQTLLARSAAELLVGSPPGPELIQVAARQAASVDLDPPDDVHATGAFRRHLAEAFTIQVLSEAFQRAGEEK
jgi:aerobic carbon-monoxide dehydrogenase medium subunit